MAKALLDGPYRQPALVPASPWLDKKLPASPVVTTSKDGNNLSIKWTHPDAKNIFRWVVYVKRSDKSDFFILNQKQQYLNLATSETPIDQIAVTAVSRTGNESVPKWMGVLK